MQDFLTAAREINEGVDYKSDTNARIFDTHGVVLKKAIAVV